MAKKSMIAREVKRAQTAARYATKRAELKAVVKNPASTSDSVRVPSFPDASNE